MILALILLQDSVGWRRDFEEASKHAREKNGLMLVHFWKPEQAEVDAFNHPEVIQRSGAFVCVRINGLKDEAMAEHFGVKELPSTIFLSPEGKRLFELPGRPTVDRMVGIMSAYAEHYPKLAQLKGKELFEAYRALEIWESAASTLEEIGAKADPAWYHERRIDLELRKAGRGHLEALKAAAEAAKGVAGLEDDLAAVEAIVSGSIDAARSARAKWPQSNRDDVFLMVIASGLLKEGKKSEARPILEELAQRHPKSDYGRWAAGLIQ